MRSFFVGVYGLLATAHAAAAQAQACDRAALIQITDTYVAAQRAGDRTGMTALSSSVAYTENFKNASIATGILAQPLKIDYNRSTHDPTACATYTELIITDAAHPYVIGTQMRLAEGKVAQVDTLVTDQGDWLFNATGTLRFAVAEKWTEIPVAERDSRAVLQAAADAYLDIFKDKTVKVPWGTPCARLEGGSYTGRAPGGSPTDRCDVGIPDNVSLTNRRYVIDEVLGAVGVFLTFNNNLPDSHEFRVEKGLLRYVHTITVMGSSPGPSAPGRPPML
jgi:hypothetical protein